MSIISDAFTLSSAGGVYFEGSRIESQATDIFLFIGLGGTGNEELLHVKNQVHNRMKLPTDRKTGLPVADIPKNMAFVAIDTDYNDVENKHYLNTSFSKDGSEILEIGSSPHTNYEAIVRSFKRYKDNGADFAQWINPDVRAKGGVNGAGARRAIGRVGVFHNYSKISQRINSVINNLRVANPGANSLRIFLFAGIAGGTGSGSFIDIGYLVKKAGVTAMPTSQLFGYFFLPDVNDSHGGNSDNHEANGYAALKELDYLMESAEYGITFEQKYSGSASDKIYADFAPFDFCHLIDLEDVGNNAHGYNDVLESVASSVFVYAANDPGRGVDTPTSLKSLYDNVAQQLSISDSASVYAANYAYISPSCTIRRIPYIEINTLIAARMFELFEDTLFVNQVTSESFAQDMHAMNLGAGTEQLEYDLTAELERARPRRHSLESDVYKYGSIWAAGNTYDGNPAYRDAYDDTVQYRSSINASLGAAESYFEGSFRAYLNAKFKDLSRGPIYLKDMVKGLQEENLVGLLRDQALHFNEVRITSGEQADKAKQKLVKFFDNGMGANMLRKGNANNDYLNALSLWRARCFDEDKYANLSRLASYLADRFEIYYDRILEPLAACLEEMRTVFRDDLRYLTVQESARMQDPDPSILIYPLEFERKHEVEFNYAVNTAENTFLERLHKDMRYWVKTDIDNVDSTLTANPDIPGCFSRFISDCFTRIYSRITMEDVLESISDAQQPIGDRTYELIQDMFNEAFPLFAVNTHDAETGDVGMISVPDSCPTILAQAKNFVENTGIKLEIKVSSERSYLSVTKLRAGYALFQNKYIGEWEDRYEDFAAPDRDTAKYMHLYDGWYSKLPSPYPKNTWIDGHTCEHTSDVSTELDSDFDKCMSRGIIIQTSGRQAVLMLPDMTKLSGIKLYGTIANKSRQLDTIERELWQQRESTIPTVSEMTAEDRKKYLVMSGKGTSPVDAVENIKANIVRLPHISSEIHKCCEILDRLDRIRRQEIGDPFLFVKAIVCELISVEPSTKDVVLRPSPGSPVSMVILDGAEDTLVRRDSPEYYYYFYVRFIRKIHGETNGTDWGKAISDSWRALMASANIDDNIRSGVIDDIKSYGTTLRGYTEEYDKLRHTEPDPRQKKYYEDIYTLYMSCFEVLGTLYASV
ncbi:MAG: hypothetical protein IJ874_03260 [Ruminococcus sp.]|nr:hypothetical protein [Ruminococcus sp.]